MPADGLTKILSRQKHIGFVHQLGLNNILLRLETRVTLDNIELSLAKLGGWY